MPSDTAWFTVANCLPNPLPLLTRYYGESRNASIWLHCTTSTTSRVFWRRCKYSVQNCLRSQFLTPPSIIPYQNMRTSTPCPITCIDATTFVVTDFMARHTDMWLTDTGPCVR